MVIVISMVAALVLVCWLVSCRKRQQPAGQSDKPKVAASIFPLADIIRNVGGDKVTVITILPAGASPHTFEIKPETVKAAAGIKAIFKIGAGLDDWAEGVAAAVRKPPGIVDVSQGVVLRKLPDGSIDPHYWLSLGNGKLIARNVAETLSELDPANTEYYSANLAAYQRQLSTADIEIKEILADLPERTFATFHEAWFYFADAYGLKVAAAFEPFPGKEPTPEFLAEFTRAVKEHNVKVIFSEPQFSPEAIAQLAKDMGVKLGRLDPEGGGSSETQGYIEMMKFNAMTIREALSNK